MATVVGYSTGPVGTEVDYAQAAALLGGLFVVESDAALKLTAVTTSDRTVRAASGGGRVAGLRLSLPAAETVQVPVNNTGAVRRDAIVLRTVWASLFGQAARSTVLTVVPGTAAVPVVSTSGTPQVGQVNRQPGVVYDALVGIVEVAAGVGALANANVFDLRPMAGVGGPFVVPQAKYLSAQDFPAEARIVARATKGKYRIDVVDGLVGEDITVVGSSVVGTNAGGGFKVTFDTPFAAPPIVTANHGDYNDVAGRAWVDLPNPNARDAAFFIGTLTNAAGAVASAPEVRIEWTARGRTALL